MRSACWVVLLAVLCMLGLGCDASDAEPDGASAADMDGGDDAGDRVRDTRRPARARDGSVPRDAKPDAGAPRADAGAVVDAPEDRDAGADGDGGDDGIRYAGGDGSSCEEAVIILGAPNEFSGVFAEYEWLGEHYPGAMVLGQSLSFCNGEPTDILRIRTAGGRTIEVYFNIADFFGK